MTQDEMRREVGRLMSSRNCSRISSAMLSIARDYSNYRYEMNWIMANSLLKLLRSQPYYREGDL